MIVNKRNETAELPGFCALKMQLRLLVIVKVCGY